MLFCIIFGYIHDLNGKGSYKCGHMDTSAFLLFFNKSMLPFLSCGDCTCLRCISVGIVDTSIVALIQPLQDIARAPIIYGNKTQHVKTSKGCHQCVLIKSFCHPHRIANLLQSASTQCDADLVCVAIELLYFDLLKPE